MCVERGPDSIAQNSSRNFSKGSLCCIVCRVLFGSEIAKVSRFGEIGAMEEMR